jgi:hypothetical protein
MSDIIVDQFPYPNEHSAQLLSEDTPHIRVRRTDGSGDGTVQGVKVPITIAIIWFITKKAGKEVPLAQALRFPITNWTAEQAKKWLADNKVKYLSFEPAKKTKEKQTAGERVFKGDTQLGDIPADAFEFSWNGDVTCFDDKDKSKIRLTLYDGSVVKHWYWGNLGFDLSGISLAKDRIPLLAEHDIQTRIGFSTKANFDGEFILEGELLSSQVAQAFRRDAAGGFPFEASLRFDPNKSVFEFVAEGRSVQVNGHQLQGPGTLFKKTVIMEGSICVFGALANTRTSVFHSADNADDALLVAESLGDKSVRDLFGKFAEKFGDDPVFCIEHFNRGESLEQATEAWIEKLKAEKQQLIEQNKLQARNKIDPAMQEFSDQQGPPKKTGEEAAAETEVNEMLDFTKGDEKLAHSALRKLRLAELEGRIQII